MSRTRKHRRVWSPEKDANVAVGVVVLLIIGLVLGLGYYFPPTVR